MDKSSKSFPEFLTQPVWRGTGFDNRPEVHISDKRISELLLLLHQLDQSLGDLEEVPKAELSKLISDAIVACGFVDPMEARYAIAAVLKKIGIDDSMPECS